VHNSPNSPSALSNSLPVLLQVFQLHDSRAMVVTLETKFYYAWAEQAAPGSAGDTMSC